MTYWEVVQVYIIREISQYEDYLPTRMNIWLLKKSLYLQEKIKEL